MSIDENGRGQPAATEQCNHPSAPQFGASPKKNQFLVNPATNTDDFSMFPGAKDSQTGRIFPKAPIRLRFGEHRGKNRGYGFVHSWQAHWPNHQEADAREELFAFLALVFMRGSSILYEGGNGSAEARVTVVRSAAGTVVLEERGDCIDDLFYSIITAIPGKKNQQGTRIGKF